jgi:hypothetical protein
MRQTPQCGCCTFVAFKIIASSRALGPRGVTRRQGRREMNAVGSSRAHEAADLTAVCASFFRKATTAGLLIPTLEWPSAIRGADQVRLRCAYPAGLAPRPGILGRKPRLPTERTARVTPMVR